MSYAKLFYATDDDKLNIARGLTKYTEAVNIFGYNSNVHTEYIPLWESNTNYPFPTANVTMKISSDDSTDTSVKIKVIGLDSNFQSVVEVVDLNGTNEITLSNDFYRINTMITSEGNANGNVQLVDNATGNILYGKIRRGEGKNQTSFYTVPAGYNFYLYRIDAFSATSQANKYVFFRNEVRNDVTLRVAETTFVGNMHIQRVVPFRYAGNTDIVFQAKASSGSDEVGIFAEGVLVQEGQYFE